MDACVIAYTQSEFTNANHDQIIAHASGVPQSNWAWLMNVNKCSPQLKT